jgi:hypothetical protein
MIVLHNVAHHNGMVSFVNQHTVYGDSLEIVLGVASHDFIGSLQVDSRRQ